MLRVTPCALAHGQYQKRLKTRMVGYVPKVVTRKIKGALCHLRSEANSGAAYGHLKNEQERMENTGKKMQRVMLDPHLARYAVFKEDKAKKPLLTKSHIQKKVVPPF